MQKAKFDIQGMTCSSCSSHVDKAVNQLKGIQNVNVNLLSNSMTLEYDEKLLSIEDIIKAVDKAGYGATLLRNSEGCSCARSMLPKPKFNKTSQRL